MATGTGIKVWDPFIRLAHWTLAASFFIAYLTEEDFLTLHSWAGYTVFSIVVARFIWGLIGTRHARFSDFVYSPTAIRHFLKDTLQLRAKRYIGHNPAGGLMIILLLGSLFITTLSGMAVYAIEESAGPMAGWLSGSSHFVEELFEGLHELFANLTLLLVIVHVSGVILESLLHRENLVKAMFTGYKKPSQNDA